MRPANAARTLEMNGSGVSRTCGAAGSQICALRRLHLARRGAAEDAEFSVLKTHRSRSFPWRKEDL